MKAQPDRGTVRAGRSSTYSERQWTKLGIRMLRAAGATEEDAKTITEVLVLGSLRGIDSHGVRVLPYFAEKRVGGRMRVVRETPATALLDAGNRWGPVSAKKSMEIAIDKGKKTGIGCCSVTNGDWITNLFYYSVMAAESDMIGMIFAREGPVCAPWGGTKPVTGTNPMSIAIPTGRSNPIVLDFATTIVAQGHVRTLLLKGEPIPEGWLIDEHGAPVHGDDITLENSDNFWKSGGSLLPFGTYKGYGINLMIDILGGALNLSGTGSRAKGQGVFALALDYKAFVPAEEFKLEVDRLVAEIKSSPVRPGFKEVLLPGELEYRTMSKRLKEGIPIDDRSMQGIRAVCSKLRIDVDEILN